jgi:hypothetical protein
MLSFWIFASSPTIIIQHYHHHQQHQGSNSMSLMESS